jgi:UDP-N-acetylmuramate--alanine ligase
MHVFFSGIGGTGIGPLALIAKEAGFVVSGSDKQASQYTKYLEDKGINLYIGQSAENIKNTNKNSPIDWYVYSSALPLENPNHPELSAIKEMQIKHSKRDEFLEYLLNKTNKKLLAFAGTHGKTTSTAMAIWVAKQLNIPVSYSVGAKLSFGDMGHFDKNSEYFIYECDEFDKNFLHFRPHVSVLTKVDWDHHEQYPERQNYIDAFRQFCEQSEKVVAHKETQEYLDIHKNVLIIDADLINKCTLLGEHNRKNAAGVFVLFRQLCDNVEDIWNAINSYPGSNRRFEKIAENIYSDYAHTPEEIIATIQMAKEKSNNIVVVYEPLTNRRQHYMKEAYTDVFKDLIKMYWVPSYLARENPDQKIIQPNEFVEMLSQSANASSAELNDDLAKNIEKYANNNLVLILSGGGGGSLDEWARKNFS